MPEKVVTMTPAPVTELETGQATAGETSESKPTRKLPPGLTEKMIADWKAKYGELHMAKVSGIWVVSRIVNFGEFAKIRESSVTNEALTEATHRAAILFQESIGKPRPSGFATGLSTVISRQAFVDQGVLIALDDEERYNEEAWTQVMDQYAEERRIPREVVLAQREAGNDLWLFATPKIPFLMTTVSKERYDAIQENAGDMADIRMLQESVILPRLTKDVINILPYGVVLGLQNQMMVTSGFSPEQVIVL